MKRFVKPKYRYTITPFPEMEGWGNQEVDKKNKRIAKENRHFSLRIHGGNRIKNKSRLKGD